MSTFTICDKTVSETAKSIIAEFPDHKSLRDCTVKIDFLFAHADLDKNSMPKGPAIRLGGVAALGVARIRPLKQRVLELGDAEILLDGDHWRDASPEQRRALLDHELHHLVVKTDKLGKYVFDDIGRPVLRMRRHDFEFGWFSIIAARHGMASAECLQAKQMAAQAGTFLFPPEVMKAIGA